MRHYEMTFRYIKALATPWIAGVGVLLVASCTQENESAWPPREKTTAATAEPVVISTQPPAAPADAARAEPTPRDMPVTAPPVPAADTNAAAVVLRVQGQPLLTLTGAVNTSNPRDRWLPRSIAPASQPATDEAITFELVSTRLLGGPRMSGHVAMRTPGTADLHISTRDLDHSITLFTDAAPGLIPVRLAAVSERDDAMQSGLGSFGGSDFDGLFDITHDRAIWIEGGVYYTVREGRTQLSISLPGGLDDLSALTLRVETQFLQSRYHLAGYVAADAAFPFTMPALWVPSDAAGGTPDEITRNAAWMAVNLAPFGPATAIEGQTVLSPLPAATSSARTTTAWNESLQAVHELAANYWKHGILAGNGIYPLSIGEPLDLEQARLFASLAGLSGLTPLLTERLHQLSDERVELLRRILPAAPIRTLDLSTRDDLPAIWTLRLSDEQGPASIVGLFNTTPEDRVQTLDLDRLCPESAGRLVAVFDFWQKKLVRVTSQPVHLPVPARSCRVLMIRPVRDDGPTLLGTSRHITQGAIDLHRLQWYDSRLVLRGTSDVVAHDPYELRLFMPPGPQSCEISAIDASVDRVHLSRDGLLRTITFESTSTQPVDWQIRFRRTEQPQPATPAFPTHLAGRQNTRGVLLNWHPSDQRTVLYRVYRDNLPIAETEHAEYQDSTARYGRVHAYAVTAIDAFGTESLRSARLQHRTPRPASTNLTQLVPLGIRQDKGELAIDRSVTGSPLRMNNQRFYRGLGTRAPSRVRYFLGGGYDLFTGVVGIDDTAGGKGSAVFQIIADGETLFTSRILKGGEPPQPFSARVRGKLQFELITTDAGDGTGFDYADWGNPYLRVLTPPTPASQPRR